MATNVANTWDFKGRVWKLIFQAVMKFAASAAAQRRIASSCLYQGRGSYVIWRGCTSSIFVAERRTQSEQALHAKSEGALGLQKVTIYHIQHTKILRGRDCLRSQGLHWWGPIKTLRS